MVELRCRAATNSWTSSANGNWEDLSWSLGVRPDSSQQIAITNSGSKTVAIGPSTLAGYPGSLTVDSLTILGSPTSTNILLLNSVGSTISLRVLTRLNIGPNAIVRNFGSGLILQSASLGSTIAGQVIQSGGLLYLTNGSSTLDGGSLMLNGTDARFDQLFLGYQLNGLVDQTNGGTSVGALYLGSSANYGSTIGQGTYVLHSGTLTADTVVAGKDGFASLTQYSGTNATRDFNLGSGQYDFYGGAIQAGNLWLGNYAGSGTFNQSGGSLNVVSLMLGSSALIKTSGTGTFTQSGGTIQASHTIIGNGGCGNFNQQAGTHFITNELAVAGTLEFGGNSARSSYYRLAGGVLSSATATLQTFGIFEQTGGSNLVGGTLTLAGAYYLTAYTNYKLSDGFLQCSNATIIGSVFQQTGGAHVANALALSPAGTNGPFSTYYFTGGTLTASNIDVNGTFSLQGATQSGRLANPGWFKLNGIFTAGGTTEHLGRLILAGGSLLDFAVGASVMMFDDSSAMTWSNAACLTVTNWTGLKTGGGGAQLKFGTQKSGLTPGQLAQIRFINPTGFPPGTYFADILNNGEVVPTVQPTLVSSRSATNLVFTWSAAATLQTATNVSGPYLDLSGAASPYTNNLSGSRRFFRLRM